MSITTLRGVFPDPKPVYKKNYIKENVKHIKRMQGLIQNSNTSERKFNNRDKFRNVPLKSSSQIQEQTTKTKTIPTQNSTVPKLQRLTKSNKSINQKRKKTDDKKDTLVETAVQTERSPESVKKLYENGTIIYPSTHVVKELESQKKQKVQDHGDTNSGKTTANDELSNRLGNMALEGKDYIKENILSLKNKAQRVEKKGDPSKPPPNYQMGVVPKYLKERQEELMQGDIDEPDCPPGHVLLPEEERKETLRVLRQSYADRIQELNSMPVRSDTLRQRKRKMEIEEELKKIDEGIKVFQRPKVYVKINA